jgi:hypothetical protein
MIANYYVISDKIWLVSVVWIDVLIVFRVESDSEIY